MTSTTDLNVKIESEHVKADVVFTTAEGQIDSLIIDNSKIDYSTNDNSKSDDSKVVELPLSEMLTELVKALLPSAWEFQKFRTILSAVLSFSQIPRSCPTDGFMFDQRIESLLTGLGKLPPLNQIPKIAQHMDAIQLWHADLVEVLGLNGGREATELNNLPVLIIESPKLHKMKPHFEAPDLKQSGPLSVEEDMDVIMNEEIPNDLSSNDRIIDETKFIPCGGFVAQEMKIPKKLVPRRHVINFRKDLSHVITKLLL